MNKIQSLRSQIDACDNELLRALAERLRLVAEIAAVKREEALPVVDRERERSVLQRAEATARDVGLAPEYARALMQQVIELAHDFQKPVAVPEDRRSIAIVGGGGRMGKRFSAAFTELGHTVFSIEKDEALSSDRFAGVACVILAVPMESVTQVARSVGPLLPKSALLIDINGLKTEICGVMRECASGEVLGSHPMFGPSVKTFRRQKMVLCPVRSGPATEWFIRQLGLLGVETVTSSPELHDRMMARVQVLTHFAKIALAKTWNDEGSTIADTLRFISPIYLVELAVVGRIFAQDPSLYAEIEMQNPWSSEVRHSFLQAATELHQIIERGDRQAFSELFLTIRSYLADFSDDAMRLSNVIVSQMVRE